MCFCVHAYVCVVAVSSSFGISKPYHCASQVFHQNLFFYFLTFCVCIHVCVHAVMGWGGGGGLMAINKAMSMNLRICCRCAIVNTILP